jgi:hypothetical protein
MPHIRFFSQRNVLLLVSFFIFLLLIRLFYYIRLNNSFLSHHTLDRDLYVTLRHFTTDKL